MSIKIFGAKLNAIHLKKPTSIPKFLVFQTSNNEIWKLDSDGNVIDSPISNTSAAAEYVSPTLAMDMSKNIYTASVYNVRKLSWDGTEEWSTNVSGGNNVVNGVTIGSDGKVYASCSDNRLYILDSSGNVLSSILFGSLVNAVSVNTSHEIAVATNSSVEKHNAGANDFIYNTSGNTYGVFITNTGTVFSSDAGSTGKAKLFDASGNMVWDVEAKNINGAHGDREGNFYTSSGYTSNEYSYSVAKFNASGQVQWYKTESNIVLDVTVDDEGNVYTANKDSFITKYDKNGNVVWTFSSFSGQARSIAVRGDLPIYW